MPNPEPQAITAGGPTLCEVVVRGSPLAIYVLDGRGRVLLWNESAARIFGWSEAEVLGRSDPVAKTVTDLALKDLDHEAAIASTLDREVVLVARGGRRVEVAICASPLHASGPDPDGILVIAYDISDRRRVELELDRAFSNERTARLEAQTAERRARFLAEGSALLDSSLEYESTLGNLARLAVPELADYCLVDKIENDTVARIALAHRDPRREGLLEKRSRQPVSEDPQRHPILHVLGTGQSVLVEVVTEEVLTGIAHDDWHLERLRALELHSFMVVPLAVRGSILGTITFAYGESRRTYSLADLEMAEELARRAAFAVETARLYQASRRALQTRERLLAIVSHDLRNSLATVLLNASALLESSPAAESGSSSDQLQWIARSAEQMNRLISDLLDLSAIELGRLSLDLNPQAVLPIVRDAAEMYRPLAAEKAISFTWDASPSLPPIFADPERLLQVLGNLLGNAVKFSPDGATIAVSAALVDASTVSFSVTDQGVGIQAEDLPEIFDLYWQGGRGRRTGSGLGLAISRAIVEAHGGHINVESIFGQGSTFSFSIPVASAEPAFDDPSNLSTNESSSGRASERFQFDSLP